MLSLLCLYCTPLPSNRMLCQHCPCEFLSMFRCLGPLQASLSWLFAKHAITMSMLAFIFSALSLETPWQRTFVVNTVCAVAEVFAYDNSLRAMYLGNELSKRRM